MNHRFATAFDALIRDALLADIEDVLQGAALADDLQAEVDRGELSLEEARVIQAERVQSEASCLH